MRSHPKCWTGTEYVHTCLVGWTHVTLDDLDHDAEEAR